MSENISEEQDKNMEQIKSHSDQGEMAELIEIEPSQENHDRSEASRNHHANEQLESFLLDLEKQPDIVAKIQLAIDFMQSSLAQIGSPHFRSFWEARNRCIQLFKEPIPVPVRAQLWARYSELSKEARRLKEILDEQSAFAAEQIEIAINAIEQEVNNSEAQKVFIELPIQCETLRDHLVFYREKQGELNFLNAQASRINALRKELIKTEMRVRQKNKFFQRLSQAGDRIFPRRKDLIKEVSGQFSQDVETFIQTNFSKDHLEDSLFFLREEIKALQGIAKVLTLNTQAFTNTRMHLSECWDKIKYFDKERKKVRAQQKVIFKENVEAVQAKIKEFQDSFAAGSLSLAEAGKQLDEISTFMRGVELGRDEVHFLRDEVGACRRSIAEKLHAEEQYKKEQELEKEKQRRHKISELKNEIDQLSEQIQQLDPEILAKSRDELVEKINSSGLTRTEKNEFDRALKALRVGIADAISDKQQQALLSLSDDDRQAIQQLKEVLQQRKERRNEIKNQIESFRKASGASGLDFEQAMSYNQQMNQEKERLDKTNQGILEIEQKIAELEKRK